MARVSGTQMVSQSGPPPPVSDTEVMRASSRTTVTDVVCSQQPTGASLQPKHFICSGWSCPCCASERPSSHGLCAPFLCLGGEPWIEGLCFAPAGSPTPCGSRTAGRSPRCGPGGNRPGDRLSGCPVGDFRSARSRRLRVQAHQWLDENGALGPRFKTPSLIVECLQGIPGQSHFA